MTYANNIGSNANPGLLGDYSTLAQAAAPYSFRPGQRKASQRRFAPIQRGGEARKLMDGKHHDNRADVRRAPVARPLAAPGAASALPRPHSAPADLFSMAGYAQSDVALPERAVSQDAPAVAPQTTGAASLRRMLARMLDALGIACDTVYTGVHQAGRELRRGYHFVHDAFASLGRSAKGASSAPASTGRKPYVPPPNTDRSNVAMMAGVEADLIKTALKRSATQLEFSGDNLTYRNLFYLIRGKTYRLRQDEAGHGLRAQAADDSDCLMRRMVTAMNNARDPFGMLANGIEGAADPRLFKPLDGGSESRFATARAQYLAYRDEHYPDFAETYARLAQFGDGLTNSIVENTIASHRAACEALGTAFDEDALIEDDMVLNPGDRHPVTARQFSDDLLRMRKWAAELAATLEQRMSFQA